MGYSASKSNSAYSSVSNYSTILRNGTAFNKLDNLDISERELLLDGTQKNNSDGWMKYYWILSSIVVYPNIASFLGLLMTGCRLRIFGVLFGAR